MSHTYLIIFCLVLSADSCIVEPRPEQQSAAPTLGNLSQHSTLSHNTTTSASSVGSVHAVPNFEASSYYLGTSLDPPTLLYRTGHDKYPFVKPSGFEAYRTFKSVRGVYGHPLNAVWKTVGPLVRDLLKTQRINYTSVDVARFITYEDEEIFGPVVIWVGVYPGSTAADTAHDSSKDVLALLKGYDIEDVEVEWRESIYQRSGSPALLRSVDHLDTTVDVRSPLTAALGVPIATSERPDAQGTVGFYFHEGGNSEKVMGVTCHHVLFETDQRHNTNYEFRGAGAPRRYVRLFGLDRFQKLLDSIKFRIYRHEVMAGYYEREIKRLEEKVKSKEEAEEDLRKTRRMLADANKAIEDLERFYTKVITEWSDSELRNIGHICYSPALSYNTMEEGYTEDWGTFECYEDSFKDTFMGNVIDLGAF